MKTKRSRLQHLPSIGLQTVMFNGGDYLRSENWNIQNRVLLGCSSRCHWSGEDQSPTHPADGHLHVINRRALAIDPIVFCRNRAVED